jgi:hypothetical protein
MDWIHLTQEEDSYLLKLSLSQEVPLLLDKERLCMKYKSLVLRLVNTLTDMLFTYC